MDLELIRLKPTQLELLKRLVELLNEVFEEYESIASNDHLKELLSKPDFYAIVAIENEVVVGGLTAYEMKRYYANSSELYIYDIAVKNNVQGLGIGKKLIDYLKQYSYDNNIETIFVEAHSEDVQAVNFYESTFGNSEKVDHFNFEIRKLKKGE